MTLKWACGFPAGLLIFFSPYLNKYPRQSHGNDHFQKQLEKFLTVPLRIHSHDIRHPACLFLDQYTENVCFGKHPPIKNDCILNISKPTLINWEPERTEPSFSQAKTMATLYGISLDLISIKNNTNSKDKTDYRIKKPVS